MGMPDEVSGEAVAAAESAVAADAAVAAPAPPVTVAVAADKVSYTVGEPIQVTVTYTDSAGTTEQLTLSATVTDAAGNQGRGTATVSVEIPSTRAASVVVTDSAGSSYTQVSAEPGTAVLSSTVAAPPAAV